jgi:undecaprenyl-diphosphatase
MAPFGLIALAAGIATLLIALATRHDVIQRCDDALEEWCDVHRERVHAIASVATLPGEKFVHPVIAALSAAALCVARGHPYNRFLLPLASASLGGIIAHHAVKFVYRRARPAIALERLKTEPAFPSGHTTNATAVVATSMYLLAREGMIPTPLAATVVIAIAALTGASRVALGWHWGSDVVGGWCAGLCVAALSCSWFEMLA